MLEKIYITNSNHTDLNMYRCGIEDCAPGHCWGPAVRDHFLIHYVLRGKGTFTINGRTYKLEKGQGFLIPPNVVTQYQADGIDPWSYSWVGFNGLKAESYLSRANLSLENPIFVYDRDDFVKDLFLKMVATKNLEKTREIYLLGYLYIFLGRMMDIAEENHAFETKEDRKEAYIKKAIEYIEMNYYRKISVSEMCRHVGMDRSYVYSVFKEYLNVSPQEYLIKYRMDKARELLKNMQLSIGDVSRSVGYEDALLFSRMFKKINGMSPKNYRKELQPLSGIVQRSRNR